MDGMNVAETWQDLDDSVLVEKVCVVAPSVPQKQDQPKVADPKPVVTPPPPPASGKIVILKRDPSAANNQTQVVKTEKVEKTPQEREREYEEAKRRIFNTAEVKKTNGTKKKPAKKK